MLKKRVYAVIDTNILVSALWTKDPESPTIKVIDYIFSGMIVPVIHRKVLREYNRVLHYEKFPFSENDIKNVINAFKKNGIKKRALRSSEKFTDESDRIFYEITLSARKDEAWLITGNAKHFPKKDFVVSAREFLESFEKEGR
ncbi:MAG: putative toxin-antitoxin system toxin component, PIN family [Treponema sp.]|nr:putative toxin-antitoxin system toxin component, PIN family [Treponema sp.]